MNRRIDITNRVRVVEVQNFDRKTVEIIKRGRQGATGTISAPAIVGPSTETAIGIGTTGDYPDLPTAWADLRKYVNGHFGLSFVSPITAGFSVISENLSGLRLLNGMAGSADRTITGISKANPAVVTSNAHGLTNGQVVIIYAPGGMVELDGRRCIVAGVTTDTFQLSGINSTGYTTYTSGGLVRIPVPLDPSFVGVSNSHLYINDDYYRSDNLIIGDQSHMPTLACMVDLGVAKGHGIMLTGCVMEIERGGCGISGAGGCGIYAQLSSIQAYSTVWAYCGYEAVRMQQATKATFQGARFSDSRRDAGAEASAQVFVSRASMVQLQTSICLFSQAAGLNVHRAWASATDMTIIGSAGHNITAGWGARIDFTTGICRNGASNGVFGLDGGFDMHADGATITGHGGAGVYLSGGCNFSANGATISGNAAGRDLHLLSGTGGNVVNLYGATLTSGTPSIADMTNVEAINTPVRRGIVFADGLGIGATAYTISSDAITIAANGQVQAITVDTEGGAATDNLSTINGGYDGQIIVLMEANSARDVTLIDNTGNLRLNGNCALGNGADTITLLYTFGVWREISRSTNG